MAVPCCCKKKSPLNVNTFLVRINLISWQRSAVGGYSTSLWLRASSHAVIPSAWGMLVYSEETSKVTRRQPSGNGGNCPSLFRKSVVSRMYDGILVTRGFKK